MLREGFADHNDGKIEIIQMLDDVSNNAKNLITDLLAHAQAANLAPTVSEFELEAVCASILVMLDPTASHDVDVDSARISADETALQIVLRNLIDNAFKYSNEGQTRLSITVADGAPGVVEFSVRDYGGGFQGDAARVLTEGEASKGAGFGLIGVRRLVTARGGTITARPPKAGPGALVKFTLPGKIISQDSI